MNKRASPGCSERNWRPGSEGPHRQYFGAKGAAHRAGPGCLLYCFSLTACEILQIADISRVSRDQSGDLIGYQRPEVRQHVQEIVEYLDSDAVIFPNPIIMALFPSVHFTSGRGPRYGDGNAATGRLEIPLPANGGPKPGWIVDGQQRALALSRAKRQDLAVPVNAFITDSVDLQRDQFLRVNNTKPLPRGLVTELLPAISDPLPRRLALRRAPSALCDLLNSEQASPFCGLIKRASTGPKLRRQAVVTDTSIVNMLEESLTSPSGCLFPFRNMTSGETDFSGIWQLLLVYWSAVKATFPDAWGRPPEKSRLMHGAGIRAVGRLMDKVMATVDLRQKDADEQVLKDLALVAPYCHWTSGTWDDLGMALGRHPERPPPHQPAVQLPGPHLHAGEDGLLMQFFFPDSQDQIDPSFDFVTEQRSIYRVRQRDDHYAHEALAAPPFDGILLSKTIVDGLPHSAGRYSGAQRHRLYRVGIREFFRLDQASGPRLETMGDCGAFSYVREDEPPYGPDEVIDFYAECGFDLGISVDHVILGYDPAADNDPDHPQGGLWRDRQALTLELARQFRQRCRARKARFEPIGVAQGWSPASYAYAVRQLQRMGYRRVALGGMVPLKTADIVACLKAVAAAHRAATQLHLLGITRCEHIEDFESWGVTSFDSTSPFRQSFKDDTDNYYVLDRNYTALRVPQVDGNPRLRDRIRAGQVRQGLALKLERDCLVALRRYDAGEVQVPTVLKALRAYDDLCDEHRKDRSEAYRETLEDRPWKSCRCGICERAGIDVALFRGAERNKRRGFHNLYVFSQRLGREPGGTAA